MMKTGDRFKDNTTGKIYIIRSETDSGTLFLEGENGLGTLSLVNRQFSLPIDFNALVYSVFSEMINLMKRLWRELAFSAIRAPHPGNIL
jgi:hypothetical protein